MLPDGSIVVDGNSLLSCTPSSLTSLSKGEVKLSDFGIARELEGATVRKFAEKDRQKTDI